MVKVVRNFFHEDIVYLIKKNVQYLKDGDRLAFDADSFYRRYIHNEPFFVELHHMIAERFCEILGKKVKPSYVFASFYGSDGICPPHTDRPQCKYTLDYCISQNETWDIYINDQDNPKLVKKEELMKNAKPYTLEENDAVILSGTDNWHYRNKIQDGNFCDLLFFHFVEEDFQEDLK